jgi:hypothetical protein
VPIVEVHLGQISDWESFHDVFARDLGFPKFYGRNMNAWIDCLTYGDDSMTAFAFGPDDPMTLQLLDCKAFRKRCPELYEALVDCTAFVNWRRIEQDERPILALSYH